MDTLMLTNNVNSTIIESYENNELGIGVRMSAIFLVTLPFILFFTIIFYYIKKYHRTRQFIQVDAQNHLQNDEGGQTEVLKATSETVLTSSSDLEFGADENQTQETKEAMLLSSNKSKDVINAEPARSIASSKPAVAFPAETSNAVILSTFTAWMNQHLYSSVENSIRANNRQSVDPVEIDHDLDEDNEDQRSIQTRHTKGPSSSNTLYSKLFGKANHKQTKHKPTAVDVFRDDDKFLELTVATPLDEQDTFINQKVTYSLRI